MWVLLVVILEPSRQVRQNGSGVRPVVGVDVIPLERFDERLRHAVFLGASDRGKPADEAKPGRKLHGFIGREAGTVVGQPHHAMRCMTGSEALFHAFQHQIAHQRSGNAAGVSDKAHHFPVAAVQGEGHPDSLAADAGDLETVCAPTQVAPQGDALHVIRSVGALPGMSGEKKAMKAHDLVDPLVVYGRKPYLVQPPVEEDRGPAITKRRPLVGDLPQKRQQDRILSLGIRWRPFGRYSGHAFDRPGPRDFKRFGNPLHRVSSSKG